MRRAVTLAPGRLEIGDDAPNPTWVQARSSSPWKRWGMRLRPRRGPSGRCVRLEVLGSRGDGPKTERLVVPATACHAVLDPNPTLTALVEPVYIVLQATAKSRIEMGDGW